MYNNPNYDPYQRNPEYTYIHGIGFSPLLGVMREKRAVRRCANAVGGVLLAYLLLSNVFPNLIVGLLSLLFPQMRGFYLPDAAYELITLGTTIISLFVPFLIYAMCIRIPMRTAIPLKAPEFSIVLPAVFICIGASMVASFGSGILQTMLSWLGIYAPGNLGNMPTSTGSATLLYLLNATLLPAFLEEFVFRGILMQSLRRFGDGFAVVISAVIFAAAHGNLMVFPIAFVVGMCIGYFVIRTGSLWTGIIVHLLYNSMSVGLNQLYSVISPTAINIVDSAVVIVELLLALASLIYLIHSRPGMFTLRPAQTTLSEKAKMQTFFSAILMIVALFIFVLLAIIGLRAY